MEQPQVETPEVALARRIWTLDQRKARIKKLLDDVQEELKRDQESLMDCLLESGKSSTGKIDGVGTFTLKREIYPSVNQANLPGFMNWLKVRGEGDLIKEQIPSGTLKTYLKDLKEDLVTQCETKDPQGVIRGFFGPTLPGLFESWQLQCARMATEKGAELTPTELVAEAMKLLGCSVFQETKLSHTGKGK